MVFNIRGELGVCPPLGDKNEAKAKTEVAELQAERGQPAARWPQWDQNAGSARRQQSP